MTIIAKNPSGFDQKFLSINLLNTNQITLSDLYTPTEISGDVELQNLIAIGLIVINDGLNDLTPAEA